MKKKLLLLMLLIMSTTIFAQDILFTFVNARNTNDGVDDYYEADIYISSTVDFKAGSGQIYFNFNTAAFGENVHTNNHFEMTQPAGSILAEVYSFPAYKDFIVNDNTTSRVSTSFQQGVSSGTITANNVTSTPKHLFSVKFKYVDINESPDVTFESGSVFLDQFFTACGPATFGFPDCTNEPGNQILVDSFDSTGASRINEIVWDGDVSSSWLVADNWDSGSVPLSTDDLIVPNVATTPSITSSIQMNDLTVESLSSFDVSEAGSVTVDGDFVNDGTFTMVSTASNSSSLLVKGASSGEVTYERGGLLADKWSIISAPVSGQKIKEFVENAANDIRINTSTIPHRYAVSYYDDSQPSGSKWVYFDVDYLAANPSETFEKGRSYAISRGTDGVVSFTGTIETTDTPKTVTASEWNAIGNPYTAFLPINENSGTNFINDNLSSFDPAYVGAYVWDNSQNKYVAKTLLSGESSLAPGQGFFVRTNVGISSIDFKEAQRKVQPATGGTFNRGAINNISAIELSIASKEVKVNTTISFRSNATKGLDAGYDVGNYDGAELDIYTRLVDASSTKNFTYQSLPKDEHEPFVIPVGIKAKEGTSVTISAIVTGLEGIEVYLEDKELNKFINLIEEDYQIEASNLENSVGRFYLHTKAPIEVTEVTLDNIKIYNSNRKLFVTGIYEEQFEITMYNILGSVVYKGTYEGVGKNELGIPVVETGVYVVKMQTSFGVKEKKIILKK